MKNDIPFVPVLLFLLSACSTRSRSLILGGSSGVAIGAFSGVNAHSGSEGENRARNSVIGAGVGFGIGIIAAYLLHSSVEERIRDQQYEVDERIRFGDLPPNPFNPANQRLFQQQPKRQ